MATKKKAPARSPAQLAYDKRRAQAKKAALKSGKPAAKKAATKRVVAKKAPVAKAASPLKGRILGPRKPKGDTLSSPLATEDVTYGASASVAGLTDPGDVNKTEPSNEVEPDGPDYFGQVDIIDLRGVKTMGRIAVVAALEARGFICSDTSDLFETINLATIFDDVVGLRLNQQNKLVSTVLAESDIASSEAVSRPGIEMSITVELTEPAPTIPNVLELHGATYFRVG